MAEKPSERELMLAGKPYNPYDKDLVDGRDRARDLVQEINRTTSKEEEKRQKLFKDLFGTSGEGVYITPPFYCDYGANIHIGDKSYMNFNCTILDCAKVTIGKECMFAPNVAIYTATHSIDPVERLESGTEFAKEIKIGDRVWIGGNAVILPGVTIGDCAVIGAGSVVTKDVAPWTVVAGNPAKFIKKIEKKE
eukprot:TRINITY_DN3325_c0_g2_i2.p1 TRINITY_DN3325_c0_g2~~TRINITY_DN3325_c0_g2_i2.p1  ORF type:complete len:193 (+),score=79.95 TRINITY_DN3325_c0_g2_i2:123-701(+)